MREENKSYSDIKFCLRRYARFRLNCSQAEQSFLKLTPQVPLEILLLIIANNGQCSIDLLNQSIGSTIASIRSYIRALETAGLISTRHDKLDRRARVVFITHLGLLKILDMKHQTGSLYFAHEDEGACVSAAPNLLGVACRSNLDCSPDCFNGADLLPRSAPAAL